MSRSLFTDFLCRLGVPCTQPYSDEQYQAMTFRSLFGLASLLKQYGVDSQGYLLTDKEAVMSIATPFLAQYKSGFVVVDAITPAALDISDGARVATVAKARFMADFGGNVLLAYPTPTAAEPHYREHRLVDLARAARRWVLAACVAFIVVYLAIVNHIVDHWSAITVLCINGLGLYASYLLVLKSTGVKSQAGDAICGVIERTGCHTVLGTSAAKFFGLFGWSEVGLAYFSVSILTLLLFPEYAGWLALTNAAACPFSFWSVWYQKYRAKAWCTLCLTVQSCLWLCLAAEIIGHWFETAFPLTWAFAGLICAYGATLLAANAVAETLTKYTQKPQ